MNKKTLKKLTAVMLLTAVLMSGCSAQGDNDQLPEGTLQTGMEQRPFDNGQMPSGMGGMKQGGMMQGQVQSAEEPSEIVTSDTVNTAKDLNANESTAKKITMSDTDNEVSIDEAGTYIITGTCKDGNITVKKDTTGVVLILRDLDLTSTKGATLSLNKNSQVKVIIEGTVTLTDDEDPALEDVDEDYDGAAIKAKDGSDVCLTGDGTLNVEGNAKNGIKVGNEDEPSFLIDGDLTINIEAANDAINSGYDLTVLSGTLNISAKDDAIHADRILTLGDEQNGPVINISASKEGLEGTIVNLFNGQGTVNASDDAVNAANSDNTYRDTLTFSINITGGQWQISSSGDGLDSNGNINITGGSTSIHSATNGGEAGIDYMGTCYVADGTLDNYSGVSFDSGQGGMGMQGGHGNMQGGQFPQGKEGRHDFKNGEGSGQMPPFSQNENGGQAPSDQQNS